MGKNWAMRIGTVLDTCFCQQYILSKNYDPATVVELEMHSIIWSFETWFFLALMKKDKQTMV
jgi:hypothetical protein